MPPKQIDRYRILDLLGKGGMGQVYRAHDPDLGREVALKLVTLPEQEWRQRFRREVQAAGQLNHPHIVTVYDVKLDHEPPYVVMELLTGGTLHERLKAGPLPWREALILLRPLAEALAYAHEAGVIHRDVKPGNIMFSGDRVQLPAPGTPMVSERGRGILKLVDFGLARQQSQAELPPTITQAGAVFGTPGYMSPEQAQGETVDIRTDIFPLGLIFFEAIAGRNPLRRETLISTLSATISDTPVDLSPLTVLAPPKVIHLIEQAIAKDRQQRYATCEALLVDLNRCLDNADVAETRRSVAPPPTPRFTPGPPLAPTPFIQKTPGIELTHEIELVLQHMFSTANSLKVEAKFGHGLSGGQVFRVLPYRESGSELPSVVKIAPVELIEQERQAYQTWVDNQLPGAARLQTVVTSSPDGRWAGLRYTLAGEGVFDVQSLYTYYAEATAEDLRWLLEEQLYPMIGKRWWRKHRLEDAFQMQADYDALLPVNLTLRLSAPPAEVALTKIDMAHLPWPAPAPGTYVELQKFVVTEVDLRQQHVTLNLPPPLPGLPAFAYRLRLVEVPQPEAYHPNQIIPSLTGVVLETRSDFLRRLAHAALGESLNLSAEEVPLPFPRVAFADKELNESLPNPLSVYLKLLADPATVYVSTIHGDLNMENILVNPKTRQIHLIDFATVRQGHSLHDLLRLETEVVTKLIPAALAEAKLSPSAIYPIYRQLRLASLQPGPAAIPASLPPSLVKPWTLLLTIRKLAHHCLFNPEDWREYDRGLALYMLGALKFKNLDQLPEAPQPKQVAFWAAASAVELLRNPISPPETIVQLIAPPKPKRSLAPVAIGSIGIIVVFILTALGLYSLPKIFSPNNNPPPAAIARIIDFAPKVAVQRIGINQPLTPDNCTDLYYGDRLHIDSGASAVVFCTANKQLLQLPGEKQIEVNCLQEMTTLGTTITFQHNQNLVNEACPDPLQSIVKAIEKLVGIRGGRNQSLFLLSPRNSVITDTRPIFTWQPVAGANGYRLTLTPSEDESWSIETADTSLPYPADKPSLVADGLTNIVELTVLTDTSEAIVDKTKLIVLAESEQAELTQAEAEIRALPLDESTQRFFLVQLYRQRKMWSAALEQLIPLAQAQNPPSATLWQQIGDLYMEVELYTQAEQSYRQALAAAEANEDLSGQAAAQFGLARTALAFDETEKALKYLGDAETLYRQAGQKDLADQVAAELVKLKEE